jgi:hypothetical protein
MNQREDGASSANPQGQREHCGNRENGRLSELSEGVPEMADSVLHRTLQPINTADFGDGYIAIKCLFRGNSECRTYLCG